MARSQSDNRGMGGSVSPARDPNQEQSTRAGVSINVLFIDILSYAMDSYRITLTLPAIPAVCILGTSRIQGRRDLAADAASCGRMSCVSTVPSWREDVRVQQKTNWTRHF